MQNPVINGWEYQLQITRNMSFWHQCLSIRGCYCHNVDFGVDASLQDLMVVIGGTNCNVFRYKENYDTFTPALTTAVDSKKKMALMEKRYRFYAKEVLGKLKICKKNLNAETLNAFQAEYARYCAALMVTAALGRTGVDLLTVKLKELGYADGEIPNIIAVITYPSKHTPLLNSQLELFKIGAMIQKNELTPEGADAQLKKWLAKFKAIPVNFCNDPWSLGDARLQLDAMLKKDCAREIEQIIQNNNEKKKEAKELLKKIGSRYITTFASAVAEGTYLNEFRKNVFCRLSMGYVPIFRKIAKKLGSNNWRDCYFLTPEEMVEVVGGKTLDLPNLMADRQVVGCMIKEDGHREFLPKDKLEEIVEYIKSVQGSASTVPAESVTEFKGFSASRGIVRGIAKIILDSKGFDKLNPGEILVTTMTSVDFVPVMERAAAFITNEGGITSHAAIVAREMKKPCIIGTKIATQVLKDGDMVEVDAGKGIVKILK